MYERKGENMIQIQKARWVKPTEIIRIWVVDGKVYFQMADHLNEIIEKEYLADFCSAIHVPYNIILSLLNE